ncbi:hypothetical protein RQP46_000011 [Phenoliferia psychrophenolica]
MHAFRSLALVASALVFAHSSTASPADVGDLAVVRRGATLNLRKHHAVERKMIRARSSVASSPASPQDILNVLSGKTGPISDQIKAISAAAPTTSNAATTSNMNSQYSSLQVALNVALAGVTQLVAEVKGDVNLLDLAGTVANVVADLQTALNTVEAGLAIDPALAPLATALAAITNGPLAQLLAALEGLLAGLLPVVNGLLAGLGLAPVLLGVQGIVDGLLTGLGA